MFLVIFAAFSQCYFITSAAGPQWFKIMYCLTIMTVLITSQPVCLFVLYVSLSFWKLDKNSCVCSPNLFEQKKNGLSFFSWVGHLCFPTLHFTQYPLICCNTFNMTMRSLSVILKWTALNTDVSIWPTKAKYTISQKCIISVQSFSMPGIAARVDVRLSVRLHTGRAVLFKE